MHLTLNTGVEIEKKHQSNMSRGSPLHTFFRTFKETEKRYNMAITTVGYF